MSRRLRALRVVHPFPSFLNAGLVGALAYFAAADLGRALALAGGMLGMQFAIGATNDVVDRERDRMTKPSKPIPAGLISLRTAATVALLSAAVGLVLAFSGGVWVAVLWLGMISCGLVYNFWLKRTAIAWACFSVAFALLPVYAWYGAVGDLPPRWQFLLPLAGAAGPALQLANGLVDLEADKAAGLSTLATRLGRRRALLVTGGLLLIVHLTAWLTIANDSRGPVAVVAVSSFIAAAGYAMSARDSVSSRAWGWTLQAVALALLGVGWVAAVARAG
jgi:4-hydroxybenzoate polyprenyltransferase